MLGISSTPNSSDIYSVSCHVLKTVINQILDPLTVIINSCLAKGVFPECLKLARTIPILMKGEPSYMSNYCPISILPVLSKVLESVIKDQLLEFFKVITSWLAHSIVFVGINLR